MNTSIQKFTKAMALTIASAFIVGQMEARDYANWMADLPNNAYVSTLSIPGTHDSATGHGFSGLLSSTYAASGQTQDRTIQEQMQMGVRAFDFRPGRKNEGSIFKPSYRLRCYHGMAEIDYWFDDAIKDICSFLDEHPSEFFIIHLYKSTDDLNKNLNDLMNNLISSDDVKDHICSFRPDLKVEDMRGKILFVKRYEVDWSSDKIAYLWDWSETGFEMNEHFIKNMYEDQKCRIMMQDKANSDPDEKIRLFSNLFYYSASYSPSSPKDMVWIMNFASSYNGSTSSAKTYAENASKVCPAIIDLLSEYDGPTGIVLMDWVGDGDHKVSNNNYNTRGEETVHAIAENNFKYLPYLCEAPTVASPVLTDRSLDGLVSDRMFRGNMEWLDAFDNGYPDLVVKGRDLNDWWPKYYGLKNDGNTLAAAEYLPRPGENGYDENRSRIVVPVDYNCDSKVDMIYGCSAGSVLIQNAGNGEFTHVEVFTLYGQEIDLDANGDATIETRGSHGLMLTADFDLDGYPDILTYGKGENNTDGTPFMYRNESRDFGCAFFGKYCGIPALRNGSMAIGDINLDGAPDVLISGVDSEGVRQISLCLNTGFNDGVFTFDVVTPAEMQPFATDLGAVSLVDVNNDGMLDVFITGRMRENDHIASFSASLFINNGDMTFSKSYIPSIGVWASSIDWCDINGDGYVDLIYGGSARYFAGCDTDGDKSPHYGDSASVILMNQGDGSFAMDNIALAPLRSGTCYRAFDFNDDGMAAIAAMGYGDKTFHIYECPFGSQSSASDNLTVTPTFEEIDNNRVRLSWNSPRPGLRYNYVLQLKDGLGYASDAIIAAVPVDIATGRLRQANVDMATTGNCVTLNINPEHVAYYGVQAITPDKKGQSLTMYSNDSNITTDLNVVISDDCPVEYYNLQGIRVNNPSGGIFIEHKDGKSIKRYIP